MDPIIQFDRVSIVFGDHPERALPLMDERLSRAEIQKRTGQILGVHDCSLAVAEGEISVLMGLSGSGKSTLLRAVNGLNKVARGRMLVRTPQGIVDTASCSPSELRELRRATVSMVFQQFGLLPWRTVIENVAFGLELAGLSKLRRLARAREVLAVVNLTDWADKRVSELSGGMQQRVGLARAFATEAPILLMDEPFSALDPLIRTHLQEELLSLQERLRCTIVFVSHDLEEAVKIGNTISIMEGGRIVQTGRPEEIVLKPASSYVSAFVAQLNPLSVLRVADVMRPPSGEADPDRLLRPDTPLREALPMLAKQDGSVWVGEGSSVIGEITPQAVLTALCRN